MCDPARQSTIFRGFFRISKECLILARLRMKGKLSILPALYCR